MECVVIGALATAWITALMDRDVRSNDARAEYRINTSNLDGITSPRVI